MNIVSWNIRGLNIRRKQRLLQSHLMEENLNILFLQETKCVGTNAKYIFTWCLKKCNYVNTYSRGSVGGFSILWNPTTIILDNFFTSRWTISSCFRDIGSNKEGYITNVYGPHISMEKGAFLKNLEGLEEIIKDYRWTLGWDFNIILSLAKKRGETHQLENESEGFNNFIEAFHLVDLDHINGDFVRKTGSQRNKIKQM
jgi:exonuclease III